MSRDILLCVWILRECRITVGETGASCIQGQVVTESFYENIARMEMPSALVGWKPTSRNTVQTSGVKKTKLTRCGKTDFLSPESLLVMPT